MRCLLVIGAVLAAPASLPADVVEFTNGAKVECEVVERTDGHVTINMRVGDRDYTRKYRLDMVTAVTVDGQREVIPRSTPAAGPALSDPAVGATRTRAEIEALIDQVGRTTPDWWDSVKLNYPRTLDLSWPARPGGAWNSQRNVGQYVWDIINPNPRKWREGVRLMHHLLVVNKDNPQTLSRVMNELGRMYYAQVQDYARAAFWWRQTGDTRHPISSLRLAECYWKLGSKEMALELLGEIQPQFGMIKLWADMGEIDRALRLADANAEGPYADFALIYAGDACRVAGRYDKAIEYYQELLALQPTGRMAQRIRRNQQRARANIEAIRHFDMLDMSRVPDGTYRSNSLGYKGPVYVEVVVKDHRIESVRVTQHHEKQFYSAVTDTPRKIVARQGVKGVDATSSATITSEAIINATAKALAQAMK